MREPTAMKISASQSDLTCEEHEIYESLLPLKGASVLELGCGKADKTLSIAKSSGVASITAMEVDEIQHATNMALTDLPGSVRFCLGSAEAIPAADASFDIVLMFKSLHHVPVNRMSQAMAEIRRVLKPAGLAYISEPIYAGEFNDILRMFHDEKIMREAAFAAVEQAVQSGVLELVGQKFFSTPGHFDSFEQFEDRILKVTHTHHDLSPALYQAVKGKFMQHMTTQGADFNNPIRVDLLRKVQ